MYPDVTMQQARKELAEEEKKRLDNGSIALHEMSPLQFITKGLDIEDSQ